MCENGVDGTLMPLTTNRWCATRAIEVIVPYTLRRSTYDTNSVENYTLSKALTRIQRDRDMRRVQQMTNCRLKPKEYSSITMAPLLHCHPTIQHMGRLQIFWILKL